jgi:hypothetical protein
VPFDAQLLYNIFQSVSTLLPSIVEWTQAVNPRGSGLGSIGGTFRSPIGKLLEETDGGFNVNADRLECLRQRCRALLDVSCIATLAKAERHPFFALLFSSQCLDFIRFWNCTFHTDG